MTDAERLAAIRVDYPNADIEGPEAKRIQDDVVMLLRMLDERNALLEVARAFLIASLDSPEVTAAITADKAVWRLRWNLWTLLKRQQEKESAK